MASKYWLKLFHETIYDPKVMMRSPGARLRWYECLCLAGDLDLDGELPSIEHMLFVFRISEEQLLDELSELIRSGLMTKDGDIYTVKNWVKRQSSMDTNERSQRYRETKQKKEYYEPVTNVQRTNHEHATICDADIDIDKDKEEEEKKKQSTAQAPQFFNTGWHEQVFQQATGISGIPGGDRPKVMEALDSLRSRFTTEADMVAYLKPYFEGWTKKKTKDGRYFSKSNCAWLYDWALAGDTINAPKPDRVYEVIHAPEHDPDCPLCHGKGKYMSEKSGRMVACDCVKVYEVVE